MIESFCYVTLYLRYQLLRFSPNGQHQKDVVGAWLNNEDVIYVLFFKQVFLYTVYHKILA